VGKIIGAMDGIGLSDATVTAGDILIPQTAYNSSGIKLTGTMPNMAVAEPVTTTVTKSGGNVFMQVPQGYYSGGSWSDVHATAALLTSGDPNFVASNLRVLTSVLGMTGTLNPKIVASGSTYISNYDTYTFVLDDGTIADGSVNGRPYFSGQLVITVGFVPKFLAVWNASVTAMSLYSSYTIFGSNANSHILGNASGWYGVRVGSGPAVIGTTCVLAGMGSSTYCGWIAFG